MKLSKRLQSLPPYLFADLDQMVQQEIKKGKEIIKLGIGDPDLATPTGIIDKAKKEMYRSQNHGYSIYDGIHDLKEAIQEYYYYRFGVELDKDKEILVLIGSKEGIANLSQSIINPGDVNFVPDPSYPVYRNGTILAGGKPYEMPLLEENNFLPKLEDLPLRELEKGKIMFLNYPNNPTGATANKDYFRKAIHFCKKHGLLLCNDAAYIDISFDGYTPPSVLEVPGSKDVALEFNSLSKPFNMTGWRVAFAVGNRDAISALARYKTNIDSGVFTPIQLAACEALYNRKKYLQPTLDVYKSRRDVVVNSLKNMNIEVLEPKATFYVWAKVPNNKSSLEFTKHLLTQSGVVVTPGVGFGVNGEGYFRIALTVPEERLKVAMSKIEDSME
ncbi:LL-diaminopimelate aminotransferase [Natranaerobius trueperi]|uniref:Aminotransferase n=1 Tax=Natranaerobius trueperi TaxID=759412 RepID=A0A226BZS1_9FIRM|nr:LL-diaminopimelate aminotransferase [Natranaerobius trueperi]OWZ83597.1 LL-diaminopimelate aminotransferase [Natranaerobius trueperi]